MKASRAQRFRVIYRICVELKGIAMRSKIDDEIDVFITLELDILVKFDFSRYNKNLLN